MTQALPADKLVARGIENQELILIAEHAEAVKKTSKIADVPDLTQFGMVGTALRRRPSPARRGLRALPSIGANPRMELAGPATIEGAKGSGERAGK